MSRTAVCETVRASSTGAAAAARFTPRQPEAESPRLAKRLFSGALAGAAATIPMSWAMELMHRLLPAGEQHPLPPREITDRLIRAAGVDDAISNEQRLWLALVSHLSYGAAAGAVHAAIPVHVRVPPLFRSTTYGLAVWAGSYLGLLPALGLLASATRHPRGRNAVMILAHVVWGSALAIFVDLIETGSHREHPAFLGAGEAEPEGAQE